ncbi:MAG: GNAT family N-acetyltransferase [Prolixibacteraceae bacterium]|jgi:diamine N-acetyltransferase|nr:GNAT family N-acetyltransferase [Prolixibacteraceae bacterium]
MKPFLKDDLITLRALEPEDIDLLYEWENSEDNWTVSQTISPFSKHVLALYIKDSDKDIYAAKQLRLMISPNVGKSVGAIDLFDFDPINQRVGIGILIHNKKDRSKGYATSALNLMVRYCFEKLGIHQIYANILTGNEASLKLFSKAGFQLTGTKKEWIRDEGIWKDEHLMQLWRKEM